MLRHLCIFHLLLRDLSWLERRGGGLLRDTLMLLWVCILMLGYRLGLSELGSQGTLGVTAGFLVSQMNSLRLMDLLK